MPIAIQTELVESFTGRPGPTLSLDPYELVTEKTLDSWRRIGSAIDYFFLSQDEIADRQWRQTPDPVLARLAAGRLRALFYKRGSQGGTIVDTSADGQIPWHGRAETIVDTTGAGDAFAGGTLVGLLRGDGAEVAVHRGVVSASFALQGQGAEGLLAATSEVVMRRFEEWFPAR